MNWFAQIIAATLTTLVIVITIFDLRERRIPNVIVFPAALVGMIMHCLGHGWSGLLFSLKGFGVGFLLLFVPYFVGRTVGLRTMGAGDVKFLAAIGAFLGGTDVLRALLAALLSYPVLAAISVLRERKVKLTWLRFRRVFCNFFGILVPSLKLYAIRLESQDDQSLTSVTTPFGAALAAGTLVALYTGFLR